MHKKLLYSLCGAFVAVVGVCLVMLHGNAFTPAQMNAIDSLSAHNPHVAIAKIDSLMQLDSTRMSRHEMMKLRLMRERARNSADMPLSSEREVKKLVEYFDGHGTYKERMSAYYVLGSMYRNKWDFPQSLDYYHKALSFQKSVPDSADYALLYRIHGQIGLVLFQQFALAEAKREYLEAERLAYLAKDTVGAIFAREETANICVFINEDEKGYKIRKSIHDILLKKGLKRNAVKALVPALETMLSKGMVDEVGGILSEYEKDTIDFDKHGNVFEGGEFYYVFKGKYYLAKDSLDKAKYFFDKGIHLTYDNDFSSRKALYGGMADLFKRLGISDSVAKYSELTRTATDSLYSSMSITRMQQLQAAYLAKEKQKEYLTAKSNVQKYRVALSAAVCIVVVCAFTILFVIYRNKMRKMETRQLQMCIEEMANDEKKRESTILSLQREREELEILNSDQKQEIESLLSEKKRHIDEATKKHDEYEKSKNLSKVEVIGHFKELANIKRHMADKKDWESMDAFVADYQPSLHMLRASMSKLEYEITMLVCLGFSPSEISIITDNSPSNISNIRKRLYKKTTGKEGSAKDYDEYVKHLI